MKSKANFPGSSSQMWASSFAGRGMPSELFNETVEELMVRTGIDGEEED